MLPRAAEDDPCAAFSLRRWAGWATPLYCHSFFQKKILISGEIHAIAMPAVCPLSGRQFTYLSIMIRQSVDYWSRKWICKMFIIDALTLRARRFSFAFSSCSHSLFFARCRPSLPLTIGRVMLAFHCLLSCRSACQRRHEHLLCFLPHLSCHDASLMTIWRTIVRYLF